MSLTSFLASIGPEVEDAEEEAFLLFSREIPSGNLGFIDSRATTLDVTIHDRDFVVHQSPTLLSSKRAGGTTGAVLWKITPLFAEWISSSSTSTPTSKPKSAKKDKPSQSDSPFHNNPLWTHSILTSSSTAVELGCGISGLVALALAPQIKHYIATDQEYVQKLLRENLDENIDVAFRGLVRQGRIEQGKGKWIRKGRSSGHGDAGMVKGRKRQETGGSRPTSEHGNITFTPLDWEVDFPDTLKERSIPEMTLQEEDGDCDDDDDDDDDGDGEDKGSDLVISCDCIYNEALIEPFVRTCADICRLRPTHHFQNQDHDPTDTGTGTGTHRGEKPSFEKRRPRYGHLQPTVCVIAQQQRSPDVFEAWLEATLKEFRVWRVDDEMLSDGLKSGKGYVVHILLLRDG